MTGLAYAAPLIALDDLSVTRADGGLITISAAKKVSAADPYLEGHFPGGAIYPGVFILESLRQALIAAVGSAGGPLPRVTRIRSLRFLTPLADGDQLRMEITVRTGPGHLPGTVPGRLSFLATARCARGDGTPAATLKVEFEYGSGSGLGSRSGLEARFGLAAGE